MLLTLKACCSPNGSSSSLSCFHDSCQPLFQSECIKALKVCLKSVHKGEVKKLVTPSRNLIDSPVESVTSALKYKNEHFVIVFLNVNSVSYFCSFFIEKQRPSN